MSPSLRVLGNLNGGTSSDSGGSGSSGGNSPVWVGYIEFDDETGEAIAADYSGLELTLIQSEGLKFNTNYKFRGDWTSDISSLADGTKMFGDCPNLTSFSGDLSSLTNGSYMFKECSNLTSFNSDLSSLTNGNYMFFGCSNLTSFNSDLSSLTSGSGMFQGCSNLTSFNSDLSSLTYGSQMFFGCSNLTSFNSDLSSLTNGGQMFEGCKLDKSSVIGIITCLKERNSCSSSALLFIGVDKQFKNDPELLEVLGITSWTSAVTIVGHGGGTWSITLLAK